MISEYYWNKSSLLHLPTRFTNPQGTLIKCSIKPQNKYLLKQTSYTQLVYSRITGKIRITSSLIYND